MSKLDLSDIPDSVPAKKAANTESWKAKAEQIQTTLDAALAENKSLKETLAKIDETHEAMSQTLREAHERVSLIQGQWAQAANKAVEAIEIAVSKGRVNRGSGMDKMFDDLRALLNQ